MGKGRQPGWRALEVMLQMWEPFLSRLPVNSTYLVTSSGPTVLHLRVSCCSGFGALGALLSSPKAEGRGGGRQGGPGRGSLPEDLQHLLLCDVLQAVPAGNARAVDQVLCTQ